MEAVYIALFTLWLALTFLWQFERCREKIELLRRLNALHILPIWTFFAPKPGMSDTHILYRDKALPGASVTGWVEVGLAEERRPFHWLWNPRKRLDKLAVDAVSEVKTIKNRGDSDGADDATIQHQVKLSKGYLILLNLVFAHSKLRPQSTSRQFAVVEASHFGGERTIIPIFFSPFHRF